MRNKILLKIHLWLAFPLGLIITVVCLSGSILVFRTEIEETVYPERYFLEKQEEKKDKLSLEQLAALVEKQLPGETVSGFTIPSDPNRTYMASLMSNPRLPVYINPYTGAVVQRAQSDTFFNKILRLHRWLLAKPTIGKPVVGYTTLFFAVILITGIILIFPSNRRKLNRIMTIRTKKGWKPFWFDLHISAGTWATVVLLALAFTGLTWSFRWYNEGFYRLLGAEAPAQRHAPEQRGHSGGRERKSAGNPRNAETLMNRMHWDVLLDKVIPENPNFKTISIRNSEISVTQHKRLGNSRATDTYSFNAATGEITEYIPYASQPRTNKIRGWIYSIHVGSWGGIFSKILTCFAALTGASLPLTGYYIFLKRRRFRRKS
ncbi:MAG: PepSY domain-containing protein [Dysgonamonadaceae bacterium]|jgi:uncharacterized iron-regulated membrane protein|nr:PepSY domain-containing protein [Dysgonamonadaceae bacterium]